MYLHRYFFGLFLLCTPLLVGQADIDQSIAKAQELSSQHKLNDASKVLKDIIKRNPNCARCYMEMAFLDLRMQDADSVNHALDSALKVADSDKVRAEVHRYKGLMLMHGDKKQVQKAEAEFRQALTLDPTQSATHFNLALMLLRQNQEEEGLAEVHKYLDAPGPKEDEAFARKILGNPRLAGETPAPDFTVRTVDGKMISLADNAGKIVVLDFWATWCPPCRASVPEIKEMVKKYPADKLLVISASADQDENTWREFIAKKDMTWPQYHDKSGKLAELFAVRAYPTYVVIDRDGFIRKRLEGQDPMSTIAYKLRAELKSILE